MPSSLNNPLIIEGRDWTGYVSPPGEVARPAPIQVDDEPVVPEARRFEPHAYQREGIQRMVEQATLGLFWDPGLGKTAAVLAAFKALRARGLVRRMLVVSPLRPAYGVWPREVLKWTDFRDIRVAVVHGSATERIRRLRLPDIDVHVINPEGLQWLLGGQPRTQWATGNLRPVEQHRPGVSNIDWWWDMLVVDESTKFKTPSALRFRVLRSHLHKFRRRYILTGTPAPNGLLDLYAQMFLLDEGAALGNRFTAFKRRWFYPSGFGGYEWKPQPSAATEIREAIRPLVMRLAAKDYLELPPLVNNTVRVELLERAKLTYKQMEQLMIAEVTRGLVTAANASVATMKCRQIANGGIYNEGKQGGARLFSNVHDAKTEAVRDLVDELGGKPALIAYEFKHDLARLQVAFPGAPHMSGDVNPAQQATLEAEWNAGRIPVLLAQPQSVAHGLNLQGTNAAVIWHSLPWDLEVYDQFIRRVWRQGQRDRVIVHHVVATGTVDEAVMRALAFKDSTQRALLDALKYHLRHNA